MFSWINKPKAESKISISNKTDDKNKILDKNNTHIDNYSDLQLDKLC